MFSQFTAQVYLNGVIRSFFWSHSVTLKLPSSDINLFELPEHQCASPAPPFISPMDAMLALPNERNHKMFFTQLCLCNFACMHAHKVIMCRWSELIKSVATGRKRCSALAETDDISVQMWCCRQVLRPFFLCFWSTLHLVSPCAFSWIYKQWYQFQK